MADPDKNGGGEAGVAKMNIVRIPGKSDGYALARSEAEPVVRHVVAQCNATSSMFGGGECEMADRVDAMQDIASEVAGGDLAMVSKMLVSQAVSLDTLMTQMVVQAQQNMARYPQAHERYMRLALKAQAQSRATLEALAKIHQPREQTVRHVHVGPDGQAIFIENYHGGMGNARFEGQPHALSPAMLGHDASGNGVPIPGNPGKEPVPDARREGKRRAEG